MNFLATKESRILLFWILFARFVRAVQILSHSNTEGRISRMEAQCYYLNSYYSIIDFLLRQALLQVLMSLNLLLSSREQCDIILTRLAIAIALHPQSLLHVRLSSPNRQRWVCAMPSRALQLGTAWCLPTSRLLRFEPLNAIWFYGSVPSSVKPEHWGWNLQVMLRAFDYMGWFIFLRETTAAPHPRQV